MLNPAVLADGKPSGLGHAGRGISVAEVGGARLGAALTLATQGRSGFGAASDRHDTVGVEGRLASPRLRE